MNIREFFREYNIPFVEHGEHPHATYNRINVDCPQCSPKSGWFRLGWNITRNSFSCWVCNRLPTIRTLSELSGLSYNKIKELLGELEQDTEALPERLPGKLQLPTGLGPLSGAHRKYLRTRGFSPKDIDDLVNIWKIQGIDYRNSRLAWNIFIPIIFGGETISWIARSIGVNPPKRYIRARTDQEKFSANEVLFGIDLVSHTTIVMEGPFDAFKIGPGATALIGLRYSRSQLMQISRFPNRYICLDSEPAAQVIAKKLCNELSLFPGTTKNIILDSGKDPGECNDKERRQLQELLE